MTYRLSEVISLLVASNYDVVTADRTSVSLGATEARCTLDLI
jgi:hypothetical protein